jgi:hypothetical protein
MDRRKFWSRILCIAGIVVSVLASLFWGGLGSNSMSELCLLSGSGLVALSAFLGKSRYRIFAYGALGFPVISVSAWITYSAWLATHHSYSEPWITEGALPLIYWLGLMASLTGAMLVLFESPSASMPALGGVSVSTRRRWWSAQVSVSGLVVMPIVIFMFVGSLWVVGSAPGLISIILYVFILAGSELPALGAFLGKSRHRTFLYVALVLTVCGLMTTLVLFYFHFDVAPWLEFVVLVAYPIGEIMSCVGAVFVIVESSRRPPVSQDSVEPT